MQEWISVKDRLPEAGSRVLCFCKPAFIEILTRYEEWATWDGDNIVVYPEDSVTHWMPLPEPPKEDKQ